jgi:hypothetical protein
MPFKTQAAFPKRAAAGMAHEVPKRHRTAPPPAALLKDIDVPKREAPNTIPASAQMTMAVYKVSDCAGDSLEGYAGVEAGLFEVLMEHAAYPSFLYRARFEFDGFLRYAHHTAADEAPASLEDLESVAGGLSCFRSRALCLAGP